MTDSTLWPKGHIFINMMPKGTFLTAVERGGNDNSLQHSSASPPFLALQNKRHCSRPEQPCQTGWDCLIPSPCFLQLAAAGNQIPSYLPMALPCLQRQEYSLAAVAVKAQLCWATSSPSEPGNEHRGGKGVGREWEAAQQSLWAMTRCLHEQQHQWEIKQHLSFTLVAHSSTPTLCVSSKQAIAFHWHGWKPMPSTAASQPKCAATNTVNTAHAMQ